MNVNSMRNAFLKRLNLVACKTIILLIAVNLVMFFCVQSLDAGKFLSSAHGNSLKGVKRVAAGFPTDYTQGHCAHCHEQHATIGGSEPAPTGGPDNYLLFDTNYNEVGNDNFCLECHTGVGSYQSGGLANYSYSYRAGGWTSGSFDDIEESFSYTSPGTSHNLENIKTFITGKWGYTANSNPCNACHNPHAAQGDPLGTSSSKSDGTRGWPVSRPSMHNDDNDNNSWGLYGDEPGEKMIDYTATGYQPPFRNGNNNYEPDGTTTDDGSNLTDYVAFCTDCHNSTNIIYSDTLGRNLNKFNWSEEKHGGGSATNDGNETYPITDVVGPYEETSLGNYVLACTDCHEPHGSSNRFLIRKGVNGGTSVTTVTTLPLDEGGLEVAYEATSDKAKEWKTLCIKCHEDDSLENVHHSLWPGDNEKCYYCHFVTDQSYMYRNCIYCHAHGNTTLPANSEGDLPEMEYNGGEKLF